jgi:hypothetical protein
VGSFGVLGDLVGNLFGGLFQEPFNERMAARRMKRGWVDCAVRLRSGRKSGVRSRWRGALVAVDGRWLVVRTVPLLPLRRRARLLLHGAEVQRSAERPTGPGAWGLPNGLRLIQLVADSWALDFGVPASRHDALMTMLKAGAATDV